MPTWGLIHSFFAPFLDKADRKHRGTVKARDKTPTGYDTVDQLPSAQAQLLMFPELFKTAMSAGNQMFTTGVLGRAFYNQTEQLQIYQNVSLTSKKIKLSL